MTPSPEHLINGAYWIGLVLFIACFLGVVWAICEYGIDWVLMRWNRRPSNVLKFESDRRDTLRRAMRSK